MHELQLTDFADYLKPRAREAHKGDFGHVLIVGGDYGMAGSVFLAAQAALRVGAGLVSVATRPEHVNVNRPEIMCHAVTSFLEIKPLLAKATTLVLGPGLGRSTWGIDLFDYLIQENIPMVVDADGLNLLAKKSIKRKNWILTPHPGEAGRLLNISSSDIQENRMAAIRALHNKFDGTIVLKGSATLVLNRDEISICHAGNPGMASGGMGDVLSGVIGGLLAQKIPQEISAKAGVLIHALAGDMARKKGERGMIASDLIKFLRKVVNI